MKNYWPLILLLLSSHIALAQATSPGLSEDPVFTAVLQRRLKYPRGAEWASAYGRFFVEFNVDAKGRVQQIAMLNPSSKGAYYGFEPMIFTALKKMPPLSNRHTGSYILPVSFIYVDYRQKDKPFIPQDTLYVEDLAGRTILRDVKVYGNSTHSMQRIMAAQGNTAY